VGFTVEPAIWEQFPGMLLVVAYAAGLENRWGDPRFTQSVTTLHEAIRSDWAYENVQSHPYIAAWRTAMRDTMGLSGRDYPSAVEALMRRVVGGKAIAPVNLLVDFYNTVSVANVVPVGGWDADGLTNGDIALRRTVEGDTFQELGSGARVNVPAGEVCYADPKELVTRHFVWRQSDKAKVAPSTRSVFLVSEILPEVGAAVAETVRAAFVDGLRSNFAVDAASTVLTAGECTWDWPADDAADVIEGV
jgi:DNA/RNA-binding domain of Phe-tRNA-synthetase-like protein